MLRFWHSTLGKKVVMGATGLIMIAWLFAHMAGNLQIFEGASKINGYAALLHGPAREVVLLTRVVLLVALVLHVVAAVQLTQLDRAARPVGYARQNPQAATVASRTLRWGGLLILGFIVIHLMQFTWGNLLSSFVPGDVYHNVLVGFRTPGVVPFYLLALAAVGLHVYHGAWSSFRSLGAAQPSPSPLSRPVATVVAVLLWLGFSIVPVAVWMGWLR